MTVAQQLTEIIERRLDADDPVKALIVTPRMKYQLLGETAPWLHYPCSPTGELLFLGVPVRTKRYTLHCRGCGAPAEGKPCSYCGTDPDEVELL